MANLLNNSHLRPIIIHNNFILNCFAEHWNRDKIDSEMDAVLDSTDSEKTRSPKVTLRRVSHQL